MNEIKNIILDLGGVILDINYTNTIEAFRSLGIPDAEVLYSKAAQHDLFDNLEKGLISEKEFYDDMRTLCNHPVTDVEIRDAWNAILIGLPEKHVQLLKKLKNKYRLFLLSNTNSIHEKAYREMIIKQYGHFVFDDIFEKMYLSHRIHKRKPDAEIFEYVLKDSDLQMEETCFLDDSKQHVEGANRVGLTSYLLMPGGLIEWSKNLMS